MEPRKFGITLFPAPQIRREKRADGNSCDGSTEADVWWPKKGTPEEHDLASLFERLSVPAKPPAKFACPYVIFSRLDGGLKTQKDHRGSSCLAIDCDDPGITFDDAQNAFRDLAHFAYTTYQSTPEAVRFRVVLPLSRDATYKEYEALWNWANEQLQERTDPKAKDGVRACFWYCVRPGGHYVINDESPLLDVDAILADYAEPPIAESMKGSTTTPASTKPALPAPYKPTLDPLQVLAGIAEGGRDSALFRYTCQLRARGLQAAEAEILILQAARACTPPFDEDIARRKIKNVWGTYAEGKTAQRDTDEAASEALEVLAQVEQRVKAAETPADRVSILGELLDADNEVLLGIAYDRRTSAVVTMLQRVGAVRGMAKHSQQILARAKDISKELKKKARPPLRVASFGEGAAPIDQLLGDILDGADIPESLFVPRDWVLTKGGVSFLKTSAEGNVDEVQVCAWPVIITGRLSDVDDGTTSLRVEWYRDGEWLNRVVSREQAMDSRTLVGLSKFDFPVDSNNSRDMVRYLSAFEAENLTRLPFAKVSGRMGWQGRNGALGFLWGRTLLREDGAVEAGTSVTEASPSQWKKDWVHLHTPDVGQSQLVDGYAAAGSYEGWLEAYARCLPYPPVMVALYASLVPPLLDLVPECPNFIIDYAGATSRGKTTTMRVAASAWGIPDEREDGAIHTWDATRVWIERAAQTLSGLPLLLDDTKRAKDTREVGRVLYDVAHGKGRGRGSITGMRATARWRTVLLSTGEAPATSFTQDGGSRARTLVFWGSPFGTADKATSDTVRAITSGVLLNHGWIGPRLVTWLLKSRATWGDLKVCYLANLEVWGARAGGDPVAGRVAQYMAMVQLAADLLHGELGLTRPEKDPLAEAWKSALVSAGDADRALAAIQEVFSWAVARPAHFWGRHEIFDERPRQPSGGWLGGWSNLDSWSHIAILPDTLKTVLERGHYDVEAMLATWSERGWLKRDDTHRTWPAQVGSVVPRCYCIKREVYDAITGIKNLTAEDDGQPPPPSDEDAPSFDDEAMWETI